MDGNGCSIGTHILSYKPGLATLALSGKWIEREGRDDVCVDIEAAVGNILGHGPPLRVVCGPAYSLPSNPV